MLCLGDVDEGNVSQPSRAHLLSSVTMYLGVRMLPSGWFLRQQSCKCKCVCVSACAEHGEDNYLRENSKVMWRRVGKDNFAKDPLRKPLFSGLLVDL